MYAKVINSAVVEYPFDINQLRAQYSLPANWTDELLALVNLVRVVVTGAPEHNPITQKAVQQGCEYVFSRDRWEQTWQIIDKTDAEMAAETDEKASQVRNTRNNKLAKSDWTQVLDAQVDRAAWAAYRQALRDITAQPGFPWEVTWPQEP